jgi:hypothetical protein
MTFDPSEIDKLPVAFRTIAKVARVSGETVLDGMAGVILKACAGDTAVATQAKSKIRAQTQLIRDLGLTGGKKSGAFDIVTINAGAKAEFGRVFLRTTTGHWRRSHDANFIPVPGMPSPGRKKPGDHYSDYQWLVLKSALQAVRAQVGAARSAGLKTIGMARQSWIQIADALGIRLETVRGGGRLSASAITKARGAMSYRGRKFINGLATRERKQSGALLTLINRYPGGRNQGLGFDRLINRHLIGQVRYFEKNLELGVFNSIAKTARAYPFLQVKAA